MLSRSIQDTKMTFCILCSSGRIRCEWIQEQTQENSYILKLGVKLNETLFSTATAEHIDARCPCLSPGNYSLRKDRKETQLDRGLSGLTKQVRSLLLMFPRCG